MFNGAPFPCDACPKSRNPGFVCGPACTHFVTDGNHPACLMNLVINPWTSCHQNCAQCLWPIHSCRACVAAVPGGTHTCGANCPYYRGATNDAGSFPQCALFSQANCRYSTNGWRDCTQCPY